MTAADHKHFRLLLRVFSVESLWFVSLRRGFSACHCSDVTPTFPTTVRLTAEPELFWSPVKVGKLSWPFGPYPLAALSSANVRARWRVHVAHGQLHHRLTEPFPFIAAPPSNQPRKGKRTGCRTVSHSHTHLLTETHTCTHTADTQSAVQGTTQLQQYS